MGFYFLMGREKNKHLFMRNTHALVAVCGNEMEITVAPTSVHRHDSSEVIKCMFLPNFVIERKRDSLPFVPWPLFGDQRLFGAKSLTVAFGVRHQ